MNKSQQGSSLLIVLVLLTAMLLAAVSLARVTDTSTLVAGNMSFKAAALQASEVGMAEALLRLRDPGLDTESVTVGKGWYSPLAAKSINPDDLVWGDALVVGNGQTAPNIPMDLGPYEARFIIERLCAGTTLPISEVDKQTRCYLELGTAPGSAKAGTEQMEAPSSVQYRVTVSVTGPKGVQTFVQAVVTR